jgi:acyl carrier protein
MQFSTEVLVKNALASALNFSTIESIEINSHLKNDLQLDSMSSLMFLMKLEETIDGFFVDPETLEMRDLETVNTIVNYIDMQLVSKDSHVH